MSSLTMIKQIIIALLLAPLLRGEVFAEENLTGETHVEQGAEQELQVATKIDPHKLASIWDQLTSQMREAHYAEVSDHINQLIVVRDQMGIRELPTYAQVLIEEARKLDRLDQKEESKLFYRWASRLAPTSPEVLWETLPVATRYGLGSPMTILKQIIVETTLSPFRVLTTLQWSIQPFLFAVSITLFLSYILIYSAQIMEIFRVLAWRIKPERRGIYIPAIALALLILPLFFGYLWCLTFWAIILYGMFPERRFLTLATGICIFAWGVLIPLSENIASWLENPQVRRIVLSGEQPLNPAETIQIQKKISEWHQDPVVQLKFAQLLRRAGEYQQAKKILASLESNLGEKSWLLAERGVLAYLNKDLEGADKSLRLAAEGNRSSPEILFNLSKVVFEVGDTKESREIFGQALKINKPRLEAMQNREDILGSFDPRSFADVELPFIDYLSAALVPTAQSFDRAQKLISRSMWGLDPRMVSVVGFLLIIMHLVPRHRSRRVNPKGLFDAYDEGYCAIFFVRLVPAGELIVKGKSRTGYFVLLLMVAAIMPLVIGAYETGKSLAPIHWFMPYHICIIALAYLLIMLTSISQTER